MSIETVASAVRPTNEQIAVAAYSIWEKEGRLDGRDVEHWLQAETQLIAMCNQQAAQASSPQNLAAAVARALPKAGKAGQRDTND